MFWTDSRTKRQSRKFLTSRLITPEKWVQFGHHREQDHHKRALWNPDQAQTKKEEWETNTEIENIIVKSIFYNTFI